MGLPNPSPETKLSGANADREIFLFPVQLTTSRVGNLTQLIHILAIRVTIHTYKVLKHISLMYRHQLSYDPRVRVSFDLPTWLDIDCIELLSRSLFLSICTESKSLIISSRSGTCTLFRLPFEKSS